MKNCKNCQYWVVETCLLINECKGLYTKIEINESDFIIHGYIQDEVNNENLTIELKTGPLFGCIKFKERN
jgi:hypothetical protein